MRRDIEINTLDGLARAALFRPDQRHQSARDLRGIIFFMDGMGPRGSLYGMAQRLADAGHVVLLPDLFYRFGGYGPYTGKSFGEEGARAEILKMLHGTSQEMTKRDTAAFLDALDAESVAGQIGTVGYCMGGSRALTAAASYPSRIAAAASFHGGNLASDQADSPHRIADRIKGRVFIGVAGVDNSFPPEQSGRLAEALRTGGVDHIIENYVGMDHGWTIPDHSAYNITGAERHWDRLLRFMSEALAS